jgi:hypothetical protein
MIHFYYCPILGLRYYEIKEPFTNQSKFINK